VDFFEVYIYVILEAGGENYYPAEGVTPLLTLKNLYVCEWAIVML